MRMSAIPIRLGKGTEYSRVLKNDFSSNHSVSIDPDDATIVSAMIGIGESLKQRVIADSVETREQLDFLQTQGCGEGQGY
jgi:EAL domain-containing protein (putative c-di-GMP-specific phosphodiesterase class I)